MHKKKAGKLQTGSTIPKQYWLAVNGKPTIQLPPQIFIHRISRDEMRRGNSYS